MSDRHRVPSRLRPAALLFACGLLLVPVLALALPGNFAETPTEKPITARWPDSTTIHVYIPTPPDPPGACAVADAKAGIQRWAAALAQRGITVQFHDNQSPPPGAPNAVGVEWVAPGTLGGDQGEGGARATEVTGGSVIDSGYVKAETDEECGDAMRNLFMHEFGHVLGFADDETPAGAPHNAMDHEYPVDAPMTFSPRDSSELKSLYGCFSIAPPSLPKGNLHQSVTPIGDPPVFWYEYVVEWLAGPEIPVFDVTLGGPTAGVTVREMPPGWQVAVPPFYLDGHFDPPVTADTRELHFFATGPGLSAAIPTGAFVIESAAPPVPGWALPLVDSNEDGLFEPIAVMVPGSGSTEVPGPGASDTGMRWLAPLPNPFYESTRLRFAAAGAWAGGHAEVFDVNGRLLRTLAIGPGNGGESEVAWDGRTSAGAPVGPGAYFVRVTLDGRSVLGTVVRAR